MSTQVQAVVSEQVQAVSNVACETSVIVPLPPPLPSAVAARQGVTDVPLPPRMKVAKGFGAMFGLHPMVALATIFVDLLLFGGDIATVGALLPISVAASAVLGFIVYKAQRAWAHDDHDTALIKGMIVGLLTAIPVPLTPLIAVPSGMIGIVHWIKRK